jgi:hypothetical protein
MTRSMFFLATSKRIGRAAFRLAAASWGAYASLSVIAVRTMTASLTGAMLLMALACSMYVSGIALGHLGGILR